MSVVSIEDIENSANKTIYCKFEEEIDGINSAGPITADLELKSLGDFIRFTNEGIPTRAEQLKRVEHCKVF